MAANDILLGLIGILATFVTAWAYIAKRRADARVRIAEADAQKTKDESQALLLDAQGRKTETESQASQHASIMKLFEQQIQINAQRLESDEQWRATLREQREHADEGYRVIRDVQKETGLIQTEIVNALKGLQLEIKESRADGGRYHSELMAAVKDVGQSVHDENKELVAGFGQLIIEQWADVGNRVGESVARAMFSEFEKRDLKRELPPFPPPDHPDWRAVQIRPRSHAIRLRKHPHFDSDERVLINLPDALIDGPVAARVITGRWGGFASVSRPGVWGYLHDTEYEVIEPTPEAA